MMLVPTYVAPSKIHGMGVFASTFIPKGTPVWAFDSRVDVKYTEAELAAMPEPFRTRIRAHSYYDETGVYILCWDNAKFMNHTSSPNCDDIDGHPTMANRDIQAGEELTCDYRSFETNRDGFHAHLVS